jgi:tRNA(Ile)-lysidine synthase
MQGRNPGLFTTIGHSIDVLASEDALLEQQAHEFMAQAVQEAEDGVVRRDSTVFCTAKPLRRRIIRAACLRVMPVGARLDFEHIERIVREGARVGFVTNLPGDVFVCNEYGTLVFLRDSRSLLGIRAVASQDWALRVGEPLVLPDGSVIEALMIPPAEFASDPVLYARQNASNMRAYMDGDRLFALRVTTVGMGDSFCPLGMSGHHKLVSDLLIDHKVPRRLRDNVWVVRANEEIVWIVGVRPDERYKVTPKSNTMVCITYQK